MLTIQSGLLTPHGAGILYRRVQQACPTLATWVISAGAMVNPKADSQTMEAVVSELHRLGWVIHTHVRAGVILTRGGVHWPLEVTTGRIELAYDRVGQYVPGTTTVKEALTGSNLMFTEDKDTEVKTFGNVVRLVVQAREAEVHGIICEALKAGIEDRIEPYSPTDPLEITLSLKVSKEPFLGHRISIGNTHWLTSPMGMQTVVKGYVQTTI